MLVLARRKGETLVIDGGIRVTVVEIRGNQIRLGIEAPKGVPVWRKELVVDRLLNEQQSSPVPARMPREA